MQKRKIGAFEARRQFGKLLSAVGFQGDAFVVEKNGEQLAALVPVKVLEYWEKDRREFIEELRRMSEESNLSEEEALRLTTKAVEEVRAKKGKKRQAMLSKL